MEGEFRQRGETIVVRDVYRGRVRSAVAMTVVEDGPERTALFLASGAEFCLPVDPEGRLTKDLTGEWSLGRLTWIGYQQLLIADVGDSHATILRWAPEPRRLTEWYINLQSPLQRTAIGFDATDHALDVVIEPDFRAWRWKDAEQLDELVRGGYFSAEEAALFRAEGERVVARAQAGLPPFTDDMVEWQPDQAWRPASLLQGWEALPE